MAQNRSIPTVTTMIVTRWSRSRRCVAVAARRTSRNSREAAPSTRSGIGQSSRARRTPAQSGWRNRGGVARPRQSRQDAHGGRREEEMTQPLQHPKPPKLANERTCLNDKVANVIATTVGSMWMFYSSIIGFAVWMAGLGVTVAGYNYPYNLMLLAVGGIMQWLEMIAILVAQNAQGNVQDKQVEHLHQLGVTTHRLVVENTARCLWDGRTPAGDFWLERLEAPRRPR